jgi:hypothetical protein
MVNPPSSGPLRQVSIEAKLTLKKLIRSHGDSPGRLSTVNVKGTTLGCLSHPAPCVLVGRIVTNRTGEGFAREGLGRERWDAAPRVRRHAAIGASEWRRPTSKHIAVIVG